MNAIGQIVKDIIDLKIESNNIPPDADMEKLYNWFEWAFTHNIIEVVYKYGELQGFAEWVRLQRVPASKQEVEGLIDWNVTGPVIYVTQCCVRDDNDRHGVMWKLIHMIREKNPKWELVCWHEHGKELHVWKNNKITEASHVRE